MSRISAGLKTYLDAASVAPIFLVELAWPSGTVRTWNGYHPLTAFGETFTGVGDLGTISDIGESSDGTSNGVQLSLSGIPASVISQALENDSQGVRARIWFGVIGTATVPTDPYLIFDGLIDNTAISITGDNATVTVNLETELYDDRTDARRYTHEDQQQAFPGDLGLEYVAALANRQFTWGKAAVPIAGSQAGSTRPDIVEAI